MADEKMHSIIPPHHSETQPKAFENKKTLSRISWPRQEWQTFLSYVCLCMIYPLLLLGFEWCLNGKLSTQNVTLFAAGYSFGIGCASKEKLLFVLAIMISTIFGFAYGLTLNSTQTHIEWTNPALISIAVIFFFHGAERYCRHVLAREPFLEFNQDDE